MAVSTSSPGSLDGLVERTVTIGGLGKSFAVTGWRLGYVIAREPLSSAIRAVHDYSTICAPTPLQAAAAVALDQPTDYWAQMREDYGERRELIMEILGRAGFSAVRPQGSYYTMADYRDIDCPAGCLGFAPLRTLADDRHRRCRRRRHQLLHRGQGKVRRGLRSICLRQAARNAARGKQTPVSNWGRIISDPPAAARALPRDAGLSSAPSPGPDMAKGRLLGDCIVLGQEPATLPDSNPTPKKPPKKADHRRGTPCGCPSLGILASRPRFD